MTQPSPIEPAFTVAARDLAEALALPYYLLGAEDKARVAAYWKNHQAAELEHLNRRYGVIETIRELDGFTILELRRHKPGVGHFSAVDYSKMVFKSGFAKDEVFGPYQLPK